MVEQRPDCSRSKINETQYIQFFTQSLIPIICGGTSSHWLQPIDPRCSDPSVRSFSLYADQHFPQMGVTCKLNETAFNAFFEIIKKDIQWAKPQYRWEHHS